MANAKVMEALARNPYLERTEILKGLQRVFSDAQQPELLSQALGFVVNGLVDRNLKHQIEGAADIADELKREGVSRIPQIVDANWIERAKAYLEPLDVFDAKKRGTLKDAEEQGWNLANFDQPNLWAHDGFVLAANNPKIVSAATQYLGVMPTIQLMASWWSISGRPDATRAQFYHHDFHGCRFVKFFIYLTDCGSEDGPHIFVRKTHNWRYVGEKLKALSKASPDTTQVHREAIMKKLKMRGGHRLADADIENVFADEIDAITGNAGDGFMEDTAGFHKGQLPETGNRLVFQVLYTQTDTLKDARIQQARPEILDVVMEKYGEIFTREQVLYMNRLAISPEKR